MTTIADLSSSGASVSTTFHSPVEVGRAVVSLRRADGDEDALCGRHGLFVIGREFEAARAGVPQHEFGQAWLVDGDLTLPQGLDLLGVDIDAEYVVAGLSEASAGYEPNVTGPDHGDLQEVRSKLWPRWANRLFGVFSPPFAVLLFIILEKVAGAHTANPFRMARDTSRSCPEFPCRKSTCGFQPSSRSALLQSMA